MDFECPYCGGNHAMEKCPKQGTYRTGRNAYIGNRDDFDEKFEIDHQPARQVYTGSDMTRKEADKEGLVSDSPAFPMIKQYHRDHPTTGSSHFSDQYRAQQNQLLLSGNNGMPSGETRFEVEQMSLVDYAGMSGFQQDAQANSEDARFMQQGFYNMGNAPLTVVVPGKGNVDVDYDAFEKEMRYLAWKAGVTGVWPVAEVIALRKKYGI